MQPGNYRVTKPFGESEDYCGFKIKFREGYSDHYIMRDVLKLDINQAKIAPNANLVIDIGAHIGMFTLSAIRYGAKRVFAFEPEESNYELLCHNMKINGLDEKVTCIKKGVGAPGKMRLYIHPTNSGGGATRVDEDDQLDPLNYQEIEIIAIKDLFKTYSIEHCDLLKIDCEGDEKNIIADFEAELADKIAIITAEFHDKKIQSGLIEKLSTWFHPELIRHRDYNNSWIFKKK